MATSPTDLTAQASRFTKSIGSGLPKQIVDEISEFARDATARDFYDEHSEEPFWYVRLEKKGHEDAPRVGEIADLWVEDESNIKRAAEQVQRPVKPAHRSLVRAFGIYRFKALSSEKWNRWVDPSIDGETQALVCIALDELGPANGFFINLHAGQDICIDGKDKILVPPTGGGLAILIWIEL